MAKSRESSELHFISTASLVTELCRRVKSRDGSILLAIQRAVGHRVQVYSAPDNLRGIGLAEACRVQLNLGMSFDRLPTDPDDDPHIDDELSNFDNFDQK